MKKTIDPRVDAYIAKSAEFARPILQRLRALVHRGCPEAEETIKWSMPFFMYRGILCHMAAFKAHCSFGFRHQAMEKMLGPDGAKANEAMGSLGRITRLADLPSDPAMLGYIRQAAKFMESGQPARPAPKPKPALAVPAPLAAALRKILRRPRRSRTSVRATAGNTSSGSARRSATRRGKSALPPRSSG